MTYIGKISGGKILLPPETELEEGSTVRVEPMNGHESVEMDMRARKIDEAQAAEVRARMRQFAAD